MFVAEIGASVFKETVDALSAIITECRLHADENGISVYAVDSANVAMVILKLSTEAFSAYNVDGPTELGVNLAAAREVSALVGKADSVTLIYEDARHLKIQFAGWEYNVTPIDVKTIRKDPASPTLNLPAELTIAGAKLAESVKSMIGGIERVFFTADVEQLQFTVEGAEQGVKLRKTFTSDDVSYLKTERNAKSLFSLDYLEDLAKPIGKAESVTVSLGIDHPVIFDFLYADGKGSIKYLLAPRIENNE